ncbi:hypothetical protein NL676_038708 [Syzygium grande]|nr:hypothetical protein NL676_038708 [Syzygium grande]
MRFARWDSPSLFNSIVEDESHGKDKDVSPKNDGRRGSRRSGDETSIVPLEIKGKLGSSGINGMRILRWWLP